MRKGRSGARGRLEGEGGRKLQEMRRLAIYDRLRWEGGEGGRLGSEGGRTDVNEAGRVRE